MIVVRRGVYLSSSALCAVGHLHIMSDTKNWTPEALANGPANRVPDELCEAHVRYLSIIPLKP